MGWRGSACQLDMVGERGKGGRKPEVGSGGGAGESELMRASEVGGGGEGGTATRVA